MVKQQQSDSQNRAQNRHDVIVVGGGAAGLMAAATAGKRGKRVLLLEVSNKLGKKILMSGGGRCNFTNLEVLPEHFICSNPHFVKSALKQYTNWDFIALVSQHNIPYHEKDHGQLFCDGSSKEILAMLLSECHAAGVEIRLDAQISEVIFANGYQVCLEGVRLHTHSLVVASGGLSIPTLGGATGFGYRLAEQFGLPVLATDASLVAMTLSGKWNEFSAALSGVSLPVQVSVPKQSFLENLLFTHRGLSGPSILQLSNYWRLGESISINLLPTGCLETILESAKADSPNNTLAGVLNGLFPKSLVAAMQAQWWPEQSNSRLHDIKGSALREIAQTLHGWTLTPSGTEGYRTAEVTRGGVNVDQISSKTMQVKNQPGLFFIGEVLDVTGHLGGFNFQWAWSSGYVAGINA